MNLFRYFGRGFLKSKEPIEAKNFLVQAEEAFKSMPFLKETIKKEWIDKGYKVTDEFEDSILIEKVDNSNG